MPDSSTRHSRADVVRRRRQQEVRARFQDVTHHARTVRPLVSRPRTVTGKLVGVRPLRKPRRFNLAAAGNALGLPLIEAPHLTPSWRLASLSLVILLSAVLFYLISLPSLYLTSLNLAGASLVPADDIFEGSGMAGQHVFWINPAEAAAKIAEIPGIASAQVNVEWPATVSVTVVERVPKVALVEGENEWWVDAAGVKFQSRGDLGLLPVFSESDKALETLPAEAVVGAQQLKQLRQNIEKLYYHPIRGLSYQDHRGWRVYFGVGNEMAQKTAVYETLVEQLLQQGETFSQVSVESLQAPYYKK